MSSAELMTSAEAARMLDVTDRTVQRMVEDGRLIAAKKLAGIRGAFLFHRTEIERYLKSREPNGSAA